MPTIEKIDLYKQHKEEYAAPKEPAFVSVKKARYLAVAGQGRPGGEVFQAQAGALYGMAYTIKFTQKFAGRDFKVCMLEGLYSCLSAGQMKWKLLIRMPEFVTERDLDVAVAALEKKGKGEGAKAVQLEEIEEGQCVQMLHVGPYSTEPETVERMMALVNEKGLKVRGLHHEIYLSDPRRVAPEKLRTILRQPVE